MDPMFINSRSGLRAGDRVYVSRKYGCSDKYEGVIDYVETGPMNRGIPRGHQTEHIYVRFSNPDVYRRWVNRGSPVMVNSEKHVIIEVNDYNDSFVVAKDDGSYLANAIKRNITPSSIDSMLIWREGYVLEN
jgi:hypothetical protein